MAGKQPRSTPLAVSTKTTQFSLTTAYIGLNNWSTIFKINAPEIYDYPRTCTLNSKQSRRQFPYKELFPHAGHAQIGVRANSHSTAWPECVQEHLLCRLLHK